MPVVQHSIFGLFGKCRSNNVRLSPLPTLLLMALLTSCAHTENQQESISTPAAAPGSESDGETRQMPVAPSALLAATRVPANRTERYVVKKGDTLWDISNHFLTKPWYWPEIWTLNRQVQNPHLIYPGDVLLLEWRNGRPAVRFAGDLGPRVRIAELGPAIPLLNPELLKPFLRGPRLVSEQRLQNAPYMLQSVNEHLLVSAGDQIYARGFTAEPLNRWDLLRRNREYRDPITNELLGIEAMTIGTALMERRGDPAVLLLAETVRAARPGDRLLPPVSLDLNILPSRPVRNIDGQIISVYDGVSNIGQYQIVTLNLGAREGLVAGNVLSAYRRGSTVLDSIAAEPELIQLPAERAGALLVFQVDRRFSYALVMQSTRPLQLGDLARNP